MLAWLSVWSKVQTCIWPSGCHCGYLHSFRQMALPVNGSTHLIPALLLIYRPRKDERLSCISCFSKIQIGLHFWYRLTWVVTEKGPLNMRVCVCGITDERYRDNIDNTVEESSGIFSLTGMCWLPSVRPAGSKTLHQQNPPVLNWRCQVIQVELYNGHKTVVGFGGITDDNVRVTG